MIFLSRSAITRRLVVVGLLSSLLVGFGVRIGGGSAQGATLQAPSSANTLTIGWSVETKTLDPASNPQNPDIWVMVNIYDQLVHVGTDGKSIVPDLATHWTSSKNGTVYTFFLRKGVKFQNGQPLKAS